MSVEQAEATAQALKALADPVRIRLVSLLAAHAGGQACVCDLNEAFELSQPTISHHLKVLFDAGLVQRHRDGSWVYYRANPEALAAAGAAIVGAAGAIAPSGSAVASHLRPTAATRLERVPADAAGRVLLRGVDELAFTYAGTFSRETVDRYVHESYQALYRSARIKTYLPVLALRFATERLKALAQATGRIAKPVPEVLFICTHNAGRSQMAAALLDHQAAGRVHVRSAGSTPADQINPAVVEVMAERGLDLGEEFPKPLTDDVVRAADVVVTMGCGDSCPLHPGVRYLDWELPDPAGQPTEVVRSIADTIEGRVRKLLVDLGIDLPAATT